MLQTGRRFLYPAVLMSHRDTDVVNIVGYFVYLKYFSLTISTGISSPVQMWKAFTPWWSSMYIPLKVGHPASRASRRSLVSLGS